MDAAWLLCFQFAGQTWYLSSVECTPVALDGTEIPHLPTITDARFTEALATAGGISGPCTASMSFLLGLPPDRDIFQMVLEGYQLAQALGEVSIWVPGTAYEARTVLVRGPFIPQAVPMPGEPLEGDFSDIVAVSVADWPPAAANVNPDTWPDAPTGDGTSGSGACYPFPFGAPGAYQGFVGPVFSYIYAAAATECLLVDATAAAQVGLVGGAPISATSVRIMTTGTPYGDVDDFPVVSALDGLNRRVATVDLSTKDGIWTLDGSVKMYVVDYGEGGLGKATGSGPIMGLGDAILYLLLQRYSEQGPERVDFASWEAAGPILNGWQVGFVVNERGDPMEVVQDLLAVCPALWVLGGPRGLRPVFLSETPAEQRVMLTEGREIHWKESGLTVADIKVCNDCTASFALNVISDTYRGSTTYDETKSPQAAASQSRPWGRRSDTLEVPSYDAGTATLSAREQIRMRWTQPILLDYGATLSTGLATMLGQPILVEDPDRGLDSRAFYVAGREIPFDLASILLTFIGWW